MTPTTITIGELWRSKDPAAWDRALLRYWDFVLPRNVQLERELDALDLNSLRALERVGWYGFLHDKYFRWKYTAPNRLITTTRRLESYIEDHALDELQTIKEELLSLDVRDTARALATAGRIRGLGPAGASGLLALIYPDWFATVDQFVVKALRDVGDLPEAPALSQMKPEALSDKNGVLLIGILRKKAQEINRTLRTNTWTPRKLDKILWTYGRPIRVGRE
jgi:hypothetical protein